MADSLRLASYNVLADAYVRPERYPRTPNLVLAWQTRKDALPARMLGLDADVLCLQEVEADAFAFWDARLGEQGYRGVYAQKRAGKPDGCAMFFRPAVPAYATDRPVYYTDGSGHLALIVTFAWAGGLLHVANTHLKWDPDSRPTAQHAGWRQMDELISTQIAPSNDGSAWVVCGDFNAPPESPVVALLRAQGLIDAYHSRPQDTCNPNGRAKRIDFIFHTANLTSQPVAIPAIDDHTPLPSETEPSDHLPITVRFQSG